jgi:fructosamine-3-kinase
MESTTKKDFSPEIITELVKAQFGSATQIKSLTPLTAGWFNSAYQVEFTDHQLDAILRIAPHPEQRLLTYEHDLMRKELLVYETLQRAGTIPVPRLLAYDLSRQLIERDYMFIEKLSGRPLDQILDSLNETQKEHIHRQIGEIAAAAQSIQGESFGYFGDGPGSGSSTWRAAFSAFVDALLDDGETLDVALPLPYDRIRTLFQVRSHTLDEVHTPVLVHWDLWPVNIFVIEKNGQFEVEGIIDWERAYWGDPESEPPLAVRFYGPAFYQGYGKDLTDTPEAAIRRKMYNLYLLLVMKIEAKVRFEEAEHLGWVQSMLEKELREFEQL